MAVYPMLLLPKYLYNLKMVYVGKKAYLAVAASIFNGNTMCEINLLKVAEVFGWFHQLSPILSSLVVMIHNSMCIRI